MAYFVHPQIKLNIENLKNLFFSFFKSPDEKELKKLKNFFPQKELIFTDMARSAFRLIVERMRLRNSEILFPAYICDIFSPILKEYNLSPIFLDVDKKTFHIKIEDIEKKITPKTKSILVCHTYGLPIDIEKIRAITKGQLLLIEDCAHAFGATCKGIPLGNSGDAAFFSLYKQFPSLRGGLAIFEIPNSKFQISGLPKTNFNFRDFVSLLNCFSPFAFLFKKFGGKIAPRMLRKEKLKTPAQMNRVSLNLFFYFLKNFEENLKRRIELALFFQEELKKLGFEVQKSEGNVFCYLSALAPKNLDRDKFVKDLRKYKIFATRIWKDPIILNPRVQKEYNLNLKEFPNTIEVAKRIVNFPLQNFYTKRDIEKMIRAIKQSLTFPRFF
jgi:dTDP-4-amino-4,6-dideoxygalactose transaminase